MPLTTATTLVLSFFLIPPAVFAHCLIPANGTVKVVAPAGNLIIDTSGTNAVDWDQTSKQIDVKEICDKDEVSIKGTIIGTASASSVRPIPDWHIKVPKTVILDLVTMAGSITIGHSDGKLVARTGGGDVVVGNILGETTIVTQAGNIQAGDIGSNIDIKSSGSGNLVLGNVKGEVSAWTYAGDIFIGSAAKVANAFTGGGVMRIQKVLGSFKGHNEAGSIRIEQAGSSVDASTGSGSIYLKLVPDKQTGELHVNLKAGTGDITLFLPSSMKAEIQATAQGNQVHSDFQMVPQIARGLPSPSTKDAIRIPPAPSFAATPYSSFATTQSGKLNGGGSPIKLHTTVGKIDIKLFN
jgi:hypothetical protein